MNGDKMRIVKVVVATALAATALTAMLGASSASATVFCKTAAVENVCPEGQRYATGTEFAAKAVKQTNFRTPNGELWSYCLGGTLNFKMTDEGGGFLFPVNTENTAFTFSNCVEKTTVTSLGTMSVMGAAGSNNGTAKQSGVNITEANLPSCFWGGYAEEGDEPATMKIIGGSPARIEVESQLKTLAKPCNSQYVTTEYEITSPSALYVVAKKSK